MARLPVPGGDDGAWGDILNVYLDVAHNADGSLKTAAISSAGAELSTNKNQVSGYAGLDGSGLVPAAHLGGGTPTGSNFLRGDNTWAVPAAGSTTLAGDTDVTIASPTNGQILTYNTATSKWKNLANAAVQPYVFNVKDYGALGDGSTDDTAAIKSALAAATAYATAHESYAEIFFPSGVYVVSSATTTGGSTLGNAQIPLPVVDGTVSKLTLVFRGVSDATALPHWNQTVGQKTGAVIKTTLTGLSVDGSWGAPSVIGGPTPQAGYGLSSALFDNLCVVIDGISIVAPLNPSIIGFDFRGLAEAVVRNAAVLCDATPTAMFGTTPSHSWATGLFMPRNLNNDNSFIGSYSCEGFFYGLATGEHLTAQRITCVYCVVGIFVQSDGNGNHGSWIGYVSVEVCQIGIQADPTIINAVPIPFEVGLLDGEAISTAHIDDAHGSLSGLVHVHDNANPIVVQGAANLEVIGTRTARGHVTAPSVPSTTVALVNPFWRHAAVTVSGGTVTVVAVDGTSTGVTSGTVIVPSGKSITLTYSSAPSWNWVLL